MGNIDLNSIVFNANLNREEILKHLTQEEIYKYYTGNKIEIPCTFCSTLRDDNVSSFGLYYHRDGFGTIMWYDHGLGESGDCFMLVSKMYNISIQVVSKKV